MDPPHPDALLGEVSGQSSVVDLLHVLLDFSFGVLQQVRLTLKQEMGKLDVPQNDQNRTIYFFYLYSFASLKFFSLSNTNCFHGF